MRNAWMMGLALLAVGLAAGCSDSRRELPEPAVGGQIEPSGGQDGRAVAVNAYLWRATLETIDFMPLNQADPFGGVIITDWFAPPETPDERFKLTVYILDQALRADGLKVVVFRQTRSEDGWIDAEVTPETAARIENNILTRARELRIASINATSD
jgi:hypothetical protein